MAKAVAMIMPPTTIAVKWQTCIQVRRSKEQRVAKQRADKQLAVPNDGGWLSLKKAAQLCQMTPAGLEGRIKTGELRAFTIERGGKIRFRVSRTALESAGLLGNGTSPSVPTATSDLVALIREQNQRISALEDQRAALAAQLGAALERLRSIDERLTSLEGRPGGGQIDDVLVSEDVAPRSGDVILRSIFRSLPIPGTNRWKREAT
jgi:hypothetical protein